MAPATTRERVGLFVGLNLGSSFSWRTWRRLGRLAVQLGTRNSKLETRTLEIKLMPKILSCPKCSFETTESLARCPSCGSRLQSARKVRILGWLLLVIGTGLVLFMGALGLYLASRSEEHTSELQSRLHLVCRLLLEKKKTSDALPIDD